MGHKRGGRGGKQARVERLAARLADPDHVPAQVWVEVKWMVGSTEMVESGWVKS